MQHFTNEDVRRAYRKQQTANKKAIYWIAVAATLIASAVIYAW